MQHKEAEQANFGEETEMDQTLVVGAKDDSN